MYSFKALLSLCSKIIFKWKQKLLQFTKKKINQIDLIEKTIPK